jgi:CheY-like chemotaxis protein
VSELTKRKFHSHLRDALNHLRNPNRLRQSPLAPLLGVANRHDTPAALRRILIDAIKSLKPEADEPPDSRAWRFYESLFYRYVQNASQLEIADQLGLSSRQLRREQGAAIEALAYQLWERFGLGTTLAAEKRELDGGSPQGATAGGDVYEELSWLKDALPASPADLARELPAVHDLAKPLATRHGVRLDFVAGDALPALPADPVALRQTLLSLLGVAIPYASPGGQVHLHANALPGEVQIRIRGQKASPGPWAASDDVQKSLDVAHQLAALCEGRLAVPTGDQVFTATLTLPAVGRLPVLAIDDNAGTLHLLQRYTSGTRYRLYGVRDPEQALRLAEETSPQIVVLDVMMPHLDGWMVLGRLRQHPLTGHIPIIVCSILAERELALTLGASDFIQKPVNRQTFLAALDRQIAQKGSVSR